MTTTLTRAVPGSLLAESQKNDKSIAETFVNVSTVILVDTSGSMAICDSRDNRERYAVACDELAKLQATLPGKLAVFSFSEYCEFNPGGVPRYMGMNTDLASALSFVKEYDISDMRFIVISDGSPDSPEGALNIARTFRNKIDVIFVGNPDDSRAIAFMKQLANTAHGQAVTAAQVKELANTAMRLLVAGA